MTNALSIAVAAGVMIINLQTNTTHVVTSMDGKSWATNHWPTNASKGFVGVVGTNKMFFCGAITTTNK